MNEKFERRIEKLPQWVQRYIGKLRRDNAALRAERGKIADGNAKITFQVVFGDKVHGIPDRATVTFRIGGGVIEFALRDGKVRVHALGGLVIEPAATNAVNLSVRR